MGKRIREYMRVVFAIYKRDVMNVVRNPIALILLIGACALPSIYAWFCTAANWDPYQNTENIRIAVCSDDAGTDSAQTGEVNIGAKVVDELKQNKELGWTFYDDSEKAVNSVYEGACYAAIIFPEDFSKDFTSMLTGDFQQPKIDYYVNEKISASAPDFTNEGADVIQQDIDQNFVSTVTDTVLGITQKVGRELVDKGEVSETAIISGIHRAHEAVSKTREALQHSLPAIDSVESSSAGAKQTLERLQTSIPTMKGTLKQMATDLANARTTSKLYEEKLKGALNESSADLSSAAAQATSDISKTSADATKIYGLTSSAFDQADSIVKQNEVIIKRLNEVIAAYPRIESTLKPVIQNLQQTNDRIDTTINSLETANNVLYKSIQSTESLLSTITSEAKNGASDISKASEDLSTKIAPGLDKNLDDYANVIGSLQGIVLALEPAVGQAQTTLSDLAQALSQAKEAAKSADASLESVQSRLDKTITDINAIQSSSIIKELDEYLAMNPKKTASFISAPVMLETTNVYPVKNYGSGVVAFFSCVALWVAGFVLIDLLKMRVEPKGLPKFTKRQAYWGRWLLFMTLGFLSPIIICTGDLILGIQCENPPAFIFAGIISGLVYTNLIYALAHAFRYIGKALAVVLLIVQIPGSSGLYPIEMMPGFYQFIHPLLPFTYSIDAFRETIGGFYGLHYVTDLLVLVVVFVPIGIFVGLVLGRWASNLTLLLDRDLSKTGMFDGEKVPKNMRMRLGTLLDALLHTPEFRTRLAGKVKRFSERFPALKRVGWILFIAQFIITFALMLIIKADVNMKLILLAAMVIGIIVVDTYLIAIAYMRANLHSELELLDQSDEELQEHARKTLIEQQEKSR